MLLAVGIILLLCWGVGFLALHAGGVAIHALIVIAASVLISYVVGGRKG